MLFRIRSSPKAVSCRTSARFQLEPLEDRLTPSAVTISSGVLSISDLSNANDKIAITTAPNGSLMVSSNLGSATFTGVTAVNLNLGNGNENVRIDSLFGVAVSVSAGNGNNNITIGNEAMTAVAVGGGNNNITTGTGQNVITVNGNGNNNINAAGAWDNITVNGNGNNNIDDTGSYDLIVLNGNGNNNITNTGTGSSIEIVGNATGHNNIKGALSTGGGTSSVFIPA